MREPFNLGCDPFALMINSFHYDFGTFRLNGRVSEAELDSRSCADPIFRLRANDVVIVDPKVVFTEG